MFGLSISPAVWVIGFLGVAGTVWWGVDEIGERREATVNARWEQKQAKARLAWQIIMNRRQGEATASAMKNATEWAAERAELEAITRDLHDQLGTRIRTVCYPKDIIKALNR